MTNIITDQLSYYSELCIAKSLSHKAEPIYSFGSIEPLRIEPIKYTSEHIRNIKRRSRRDMNTSLHFVDQISLTRLTLHQLSIHIRVRARNDRWRRMMKCNRRNSI